MHPRRLIVPITTILVTSSSTSISCTTETKKSKFDFIIVAPLSRSSVSASSVALHELRATSPTSPVLLVRSTSAPQLPLQLDSCSPLLCEEGGKLCTVDCGSAALRLDSRVSELHLGKSSSSSSAQWKNGILLLSRLGDVVLPKARIAAEAASRNRLFLAATPDDALELGTALGAALNPPNRAVLLVGNDNGGNGGNGSATVIGGGWAAAAAASALAGAGVKVKIITSSPTILANELPRPLTLFIEKRLRSIGATVLPFSLVEFVATTGEGVVTAPTAVATTATTKTPTGEGPLAVHVSRTFDSLSTKVVPSDVIIVSPSADSIPGDISLAEGLGSRMTATTTTPTSTLPMNETRLNSIEISSDLRFQVNAELGSGMGVFVSGAAVSWPDTSSCGTTHISAPANVEHDVASARYAARRLGRAPPPSLPYIFHPATTYNLPSLNITALAIGTCDSKFQTFGFWVPSTNNNSIVARPNAAVAASRLGVVFYLDNYGAVVGVLFWDASGNKVDYVERKETDETTASTVLGRRLIEQTSIQPLTGEREMIASVLNVAANTLLSAHHSGSSTTTQLIPQWVPPRLPPMRSWPYGFGSAATVNAPDWARK